MIRALILMTLFMLLFSYGGWYAVGMCFFFVCGVALLTGIMEGFDEAQRKK